MKLHILDEDVEQLELSYTAGESELVNYIGKLVVFPKPNTHISYDPAILFQVYPKEKCTYMQ